MTVRSGSSLAGEEPGGRAGAVAVAGLVERWAAPAVAFFSVSLLAFDQGGYFPPSWGWAAVGLLVPVLVWLFVGGRREVGALDGALLAGAAVWTAWATLSVAWSDAPGRSLVDSERPLVYVSAIACILVLGRRVTADLLAGAVLAAIVVVDAYSLSTRLLPDRLGTYDPVSTYRLSDPVGYWNGLGLFTVIGILLAVGFAARGARGWIRVVSAVALVELLPVFYFTFSRASWVVLGLGIVVALLYDARRLQLASWMLLLAPAPAVATLLAARSGGLTHAKRPLAEAVHDGHRLGVALLLLAVVQVAAALLGLAVERRARLSRRTKLAYVGALAALVVAVAIAALVRVGGPADAVRRAYDSFRAPPGATGTNLNKRLLSLSSNGRTDLWHVAWLDYKKHPVLGSGSGTYDRYWFRYRKTNFNARDAHSVYVETLAELGPVGLAALVVLLAVPFVAAARVRRHPLAAVSLAAYLAFVVHAGVDWDFELAGVTLAGLFVGCMLVVAARDARSRLFDGAGRYVAGFVGVVVLAYALWGLLANSALATSKDAREHGNVVKAARQADRAHQLMPWFADTWEALGFAQSQAGNRAAAAASFRRAIAQDDGDWTYWLDLAAVTRGHERARAVDRVKQLNPLSFEIQGLG